MIELTIKQAARQATAKAINALDNHKNAHKWERVDNPTVRCKGRAFVVYVPIIDKATNGKFLMRIQMQMSVRTDYPNGYWHIDEMLITEKLAN